MKYLPPPLPILKIITNSRIKLRHVVINKLMLSEPRFRSRVKRVYMSPIYMASTTPTLKLRFHLRVMWMWTMNVNDECDYWTSVVFFLHTASDTLWRPCVRVDFPSDKTFAMIGLISTCSDSFCRIRRLHSDEWNHSYTNPMFLIFCRIRRSQYARVESQLNASRLKYACANGFQPPPVTSKRHKRVTSLRLLQPRLLGQYTMYILHN